MSDNPAPDQALRRRFLDYLLIVSGAALCGTAIAVLLVPNEIVGGGLTGLAVIGYHLLGVPTGLGLALMNLPVLWLGWRRLGGRQLFIRSLAGVLVMSTVTDLVVAQGWVPTTDRLLVIFYGGLLNGIGLALVFRGRGTTGGTDILGRLLHRWLDIAVGQAILAVNILVFVLAAAFLGLEEAAVALMTSFVMTKSLDSVLHGMSSSRSAFIVTDRPQEVAAAIKLHLNRGVTITPAGEAGSEAGRERFLLFSVVARAESARLKRRVEEADPLAFMTISTPNEVLGPFAPAVRLNT
jgi:uncharacterized membrane-anchored protein YitT (DUF2179 family)